MNEYLVIFSPPRWVKEYVEMEKERINARYGVYPGRHSIAHITVGNVIIPENRKGLFFEHLAERVSEVETFEFVINGYNAFSESGTIFLECQESGNFDQVVDKFDYVVKLFNLKKGSSLSRSPHIAIARKLEKVRFAKAYYEEYFAKSYREHFDAYELTVLRWDEYEEKFKIHDTLPLFDPVVSCI